MITSGARDEEGWGSRAVGDLGVRAKGVFARDVACCSDFSTPAMLTGSSSIRLNPYERSTSVRL